jgi:hypothetical protein
LSYLRGFSGLAKNRKEAQECPLNLKLLKLFGQPLASRACEGLHASQERGRTGSEKVKTIEAVRQRFVYHHHAGAGMPMMSGGTAPM